MLKIKVTSKKNEDDDELNDLIVDYGSGEKTVSRSVKFINDFECSLSVDVFGGEILFPNKREAALFILGYDLGEYEGGRLPERDFVDTMSEIQAVNETIEELKANGDMAQVDKMISYVHALRLVSRSSRLKRLIQLDAPAFILNEEIKLVHESANEFELKEIEKFKNGDEKNVD